MLRTEGGTLLAQEDSQAYKSKGIIIIGKITRLLIVWENSLKRSTRFYSVVRKLLKIKKK